MKKNTLLGLTYILSISLVHAVIIETKPLNSSLSSSSSHKEEIVCKFDQSQIKELMERMSELEDQTTEKLDELVQKIERLEKQQREFLALMSEMLSKMQGSQDISTDSAQYQSALDAMKAQKFPQALSLWNEFIEKNPKHEKIPFAYYWIAEIHGLEGKDDLAKNHYLYLIKNYPNHPKTPEVLFKLGQMEYNQGHKKIARQHWTSLLEQHPSSQAAHLAKKQLAKLENDDTQRT